MATTQKPQEISKKLETKIIALIIVYWNLTAHTCG